MSASYNASIAFLSTYPPTVCGIATYTSSLVAAIGADIRRPRRLGVVSLTDRPIGAVQPPVVFHHRLGDRASRREAVRVLNQYDSVSVQHEFGIFGARDGAEVSDLMWELTVPTAVTLHTVLQEPSASQRTIIERIGRLAERVVVMSDTASDRLTARYDVDPAVVRVIPHGADSAFAGPSLASGIHPLVLTWGLAGPGKGLEWSIEAFADLVDLDPLPRYLIAGATHPEVRRRSGEAYRQSLVGLTSRLGIGNLVTFDDRYLSRSALAALVRSADVVVLPYASVEQVTSGVLVEALAASKPVIATPFPHAVELLSGGAGAIVPYGEPAALSETLRSLLSDPVSMASMTHHAGKLAREWYWPTVGRRFADTMSGIVGGSQEPLVAATRSIAG